MKHEVRTPEQALLYLTDCTLATVASMAMKKSKSKSEFERQINIAQTAVDWIVQFENIHIQIDSRIYQVTSLPNRSVKEWASQYCD